MRSVNLFSSFQSPAKEVAYQAVDSKNGDNFESGVYTIRRKPVPSSSLHSIGSHGSSIAPQKSATTGISPRTLRRDYLELISSILVLALPLPFFALAFYSAHMDGKDMKQDQWQSMQAYMKVSVTAFPIVFAAIAGRTMKKTSSWRLENGARIGTLEQLVGSTSLGGTIASVFSLRLYNALAPTLLLIWALSPIGGQSSLHLVTTGTRHEFSTVNVTYFDTRSESVFAQNDQSVIIYLQTTNAVFQTSMMEPLSATSSQRDLWGNVKIPALSSIASPYALKSPDWTNIAFGPDLSYSSLLGIPLSGLPLNGRTNMTLETSYLTLTQVEQPSNITNLDGSRLDNFTTCIDMNNGTWHWTVPMNTTRGGLIMAIDGFNADAGLPVDIYDEYSLDTEFVHHAARYVAVYSPNFDYTRFYMLSTTYIEAAVLCDGLPPLCQPTAIRASQQPHINSNLTNLAFVDTWFMFGADMVAVAAAASLEPGTPGLTEAFVIDPSSVVQDIVAGKTEENYYLTATHQQLETRTQQLINTYWQAGVNPALVTVGFEVVYGGSNAEGNIRSRSVEATNEISIDIYRVNWAWWVAFMCATSIMFALACLAFLVDCFLQGPEVLGYCTTFLRDSPFTISGRGVGSAMGASERTRRWKNVEIKLADVKVGEDVGYIAVMEVDKAQGRSQGNCGKETSFGGKLEMVGDYMSDVASTLPRGPFFAPRPLGRSHS